MWLIVFYIAGLLDLHMTRNDVVFFRTLLTSIIVCFGLSIAFFYLIPSFGVAPKTNLFIFSAIAVILLFLWRSLFNTLTARHSSNATLIVGNNSRSQELYDYLLSHPQLGYRALGIIDITDSSAQSAVSKVTSYQKIDVVIFSKEALNLPNIIDELYKLLHDRINFHLLSNFYESITGKIPLDAIDQIWFLENLSEGTKRTYDVMKRMFDLSLAICLGLISIPLFPIIMLAIKLDSDGPTIIKQKRVGKEGKTFYLYKFRNMFANSPDGSAEGTSGPQWAIEDDPRVTRVGKFIRKSRLDEIPQFWNILKGEMSFVGPRPERPEFHKELNEKIPFYEERYITKPGLTGWAQIKFKLDFRGKMTIQDTFEKLKYDLYYIKNRSFLLDMSILLRTIKIILQKVLQF